MLGLADTKTVQHKSIMENALIPSLEKHIQELEEKPQMGKIVAVGPGKTSDSGSNIKMTVKVGDKVLYGKYSGTEITFENEDYLIMKENDIFAIL